MCGQDAQSESGYNPEEIQRGAAPARPGAGPVEAAPLSFHGARFACKTSTSQIALFSHNNPSLCAPKSWLVEDSFSQ